MPSANKYIFNKVFNDLIESKYGKNSTIVDAVKYVQEHDDDDLVYTLANNADYLRLKDQFLPEEMEIFYEVIKPLFVEDRNLAVKNYLNFIGKQVKYVGGDYTLIFDDRKNNVLIYNNETNEDTCVSYTNYFNKHLSLMLDATVRASNDRLGFASYLVEPDVFKKGYCSYLTSFQLSFRFNI